MQMAMDSLRRRYASEIELLSSPLLPPVPDSDDRLSKQVMGKLMYCCAHCGDLQFALHQLPRRVSGHKETDKIALSLTVPGQKHAFTNEPPKRCTVACTTIGGAVSFHTIKSRHKLRRPHHCVLNFQLWWG